MTPPVVPLAEPFPIGTVLVPNRVVIAPMAGITNGAFRRRLKAFGAGLVSTEMVSAYGLLYGNRRTQEYLAFNETERPIAVQLFGDRPEVVARAVELALSREPRPDVIDLNMGCPVRKVMKTGAGAALLADPANAAAVARAAVGVAAPVGVPVTVKLRSGLRSGEVVAVELAGRLEDAGVEALGIHPRTADQFYRGRADHRTTAEIVRAVAIPVIASGDIDGVAAARSIREATGAAAVMVARGMLGDPWLVRRLLADDVADRRPTLPEAARELWLLLQEASADMGSERAARWCRKLVAWYLRAAGAPGRTVQELQGLGAQPLGQALESLARSGDR